jgi:hypothetical protein
MSPGEWDDLGWDLQRTYLEGLAQDENVPLSINEDDVAGASGGIGPTVRENVDAGVSVINLSEMKNELEAARARREAGGGV